MIEKRFLFLLSKNTLDRLLREGEIQDKAIVFIKDPLAIWTHGTYYEFNVKSPADLLTQLQIDAFLTSGDLAGYAHTTDLDNYLLKSEKPDLSGYLTISQFFKFFEDNNGWALGDKLPIILSDEYISTEKLLVRYQEFHEFVVEVRSALLNVVLKNDLKSIIVNGQPYSIIGNENIVINTGGSGSASLTEEQQLALERVMEEMHPLSITFTLSPTQGTYGQTTTCTLQWSFSKDGEPVVPTGQITLDNVVMSQASSGSTQVDITSSHTFVLKVINNGVTYTESRRCTVPIPADPLSEAWVGFGPIDLNQTTNLEPISDDSLLFRQQGYTLVNPTSGQYLWVVTKKTVSRISTDFSTPFQRITTSNEYNWYRTTNDVSACTLTYYFG